MIKIYTKVAGKLACWDTDATESNYVEAIHEVSKYIRTSVDRKHKTPILAVVCEDEQLEAA